MNATADAASPSGPGARAWPRRLALAAVLLFALGLRVAFGWPAPNPRRAVDERYSLENAESLLRSRSFAPVNAFHPTLSFLPQTLWLALVDACDCTTLGTDATSVLRPRPDWHPGWEPRFRPGVGIRLVPHVSSLGFRACRLFQALLGTLTVALVYFIGRSYGSTATGLGAAIAAAGAPWLIWSSGICNEDAGMVLAFTLVIAATCACCVEPSWRRFVLVGVACGAALASKFNAAPAALPITGWVVARPREWRRELPRLFAAGAIALALFLALDPHFLTRPEMLRRDFAKTVRNYGQKSRAQHHGRLAVAWSGLASAVDDGYLGPFAGGAALAGALLLLARRRRDEASGALRVAILGFPLAYIGLYALATGNVSPHNWMPIVPSAALGAGVLLDAACRLRRLAGPPAAVRLAAPIVVAAAIAGAPMLGIEQVYRALVPTTSRLAMSRIDELCDGRCRIGIEIGDDKGYVGPEAPLVRAVWVEPRDGERFRAAELGALDGWIVPARDEGAERARVERELVVGAVVERIASRPFEARGPELRLVYRPWREQSRRNAELLEPDGEGVWRFSGPPLPEPPATAVTVIAALTAGWRSGDCWLQESGGQRIELQEITSAGPSRQRYFRRRVASKRFVPDPSSGLAIVCHGRRGHNRRFRPTVEIVSWTAPVAAQGEAGRR